MNPDWAQVGKETVSRLQSLLRFDTTNPPGNELPLARFIASELRAANIETKILEPSPNRAALIGILHGTGELKPVMLLAHMDVVGVEREQWSCDPFGGELRDGYVYGRGAIDDKGMLAANFTTMLLLAAAKASGEKFRRDVVFLATSDEEGGGEWGMGWLLENHPELLDAEFALNEGGRTRIIEGGKTYLAVQSAEKISYVVSVTSRGPAGHASVPLVGNAIFRLARAVEKISRHREPICLTPTTSRFFSELARIWPDGVQADAMRKIASANVDERKSAGAILSNIPVFNAVLRNGISATMISGGIRHNVIPATASASFNIRTLPGQSIDDLLDRLRRSIEDPEIELRVTQRGMEAPASNPDSEMFRAIAESVKAIRPDVPVVPYLSTGVTDSARLRGLGVQAYGILPFPMTQADEERMHGHDERVSVDALMFGTRLIYETVLRIAR